MFIKGLKKIFVKQYKVVFKDYNGIILKEGLVDKNSLLQTPVYPTRKGYKFLGWYHNGKEYQNGKWKVVHDITLIAKWEKNQYTIFFNTDGGTHIKPITQDYQTEVIKPKNPTKEGHKFLGWYCNGFDYQHIKWIILNNITLTAKWQINQYSITFNTDGGTKIQSIIQDYNTEIIEPDNPIKEGYNFIGWDKEIPKNMPAYNIILTALWKKIEYIIRDDCIVRYIGSAKELNIPNTYYNNGKLIKIKSIGAKAFDECNDLKSIMIPDGVECIEEGAFSNCFHLSNITVNENNLNYKSIDGNLYSKDGKILIQYTRYKQEETFIIPKNVIRIGNSAFKNCYNLKKIKIPDNVLSIGQNAFEWCYGLESIEIPNSVTSIENFAFKNCEELREIEIPKNVTYIGYGAFSDCYYLTDITVSKNNLNYKSIDGNLYSKDGKTLIQYTKGKKESSFVIPKSVTRIEANAFEGCYSLTNIVIPNSVASICSFAFYKCSSLTALNIPRGVTNIGSFAFYECKSLVDISISESVVNIEANAFEWCYMLTNITVDQNNLNYKSIDGNLYTKDGKILIRYAQNKKETSFIIPDGVAKIEGNAFKGCNALTSIEIPKSVMIIGDSAFSGCNSLTSITLPDGVASIGDSAFDGCSSLVNITLPDGVASIGDSAFKGCSSLTNMILPNGVTSIGDSAFAGCSSLANITLQNGVKKIGSNAFNECKNFTKIKIPASVTIIGHKAFSRCESLESIIVDENNLYYKSIDDNLYSKDSKTLIQYAIGKIDTSFKVLDDVTKIENSAFLGCSNLIKIEIPNSVTTIGDSAFYCCYKLEDVKMGNGVITIENFAFCNCESLLEIKLPEKVKIIGEYAFFRCLRITSIDIPESVISIEDSALRTGSKLLNINVDENNLNYKSIDGNLYSKDGKSLIQYSIGKEETVFVIPNCVRSIGEFAFNGSENLINVIIPKSVTNIEDFAFYECLNLKDVEIPDGVLSIGIEAFAFCDSLVRITIAKSVEMIGIDAFRNCESILSIKIDENNLKYMSIDERIYTKNGKMFIT